MSNGYVKLSEVCADFNEVSRYALGNPHPKVTEYSQSFKTLDEYHDRYIKELHKHNVGVEMARRGMFCYYLIHK